MATRGQGPLPPFWLQLLDVYRRNPTRMIRYLQTCAFGENMFALRKEILGGDTLQSQQGS
jgi:hypothetical protein